jgi:hypothetical protein
MLPSVGAMDMVGHRLEVLTARAGWEDDQCWPNVKVAQPNRCRRLKAVALQLSVCVSRDVRGSACIDGAGNGIAMQGDSRGHQGPRMLLTRLEVEVVVPVVCLGDAGLQLRRTVFPGCMHD